MDPNLEKKKSNSQKQNHEMAALSNKLFYSRRAEEGASHKTRSQETYFGRMCFNMIILCPVNG